MIITIVITILLLISIGVNIFIGLALAAQLKKIDKLEKELDNYDEYVVRFQDELKNTYIHLKEIDDRNLFEKDDDVGSTFSEILRIVKELDDKINVTEDTQSADLEK